MAESLEINMHTVLRAYSDLEERGLVEMRRGRGGVVVTSGADVGSLVNRLVGEARRQKMAKSDLLTKVEEAWR